MLDAYHSHVKERAQDGLPPLPLSAEQTAELIDGELYMEIPEKIPEKYGEFVDIDEDMVCLLQKSTEAIIEMLV